MMAFMELPLLDDDLDDDGVIEPAQVVPDVDVPESAVLCFFGDVVHDMVATRPDARLITKLASEAGTSPVWEIDVGGRPVAVLQPGVGAPLAVAYAEELIAMGVRRVIACGGAGALVPELAVGSAVVVDSAVRDEGTSYHYAPAGGVIDADPHAVATIVKACEADGVAHVVGRSWTTDAIYRETRGRVARRVGQQCLVVEMEASALLSLARFRGVAFGQVLMAGDTLAEETWDHRGWMFAREARERLFWIAAQAAAAL